MSSRNKLGYLPTDIDHSLTIKDVPENLHEDFKEMNQLSQEADYMIITSQTSENTNKKEIVIQQLKQLGLEEGSDFITYVMDPDPSTQVSKVFISIQISQQIIDDTAHKFENKGTLTNSQIPIFIKGTFKQHNKDMFNAFDGIRK